MAVARTLSLVSSPLMSVSAHYPPGENPYDGEHLMISIDSSTVGGTHVNVRKVMLAKNSDDAQKDDTADQLHQAQYTDVAQVQSTVCHVSGR